MTKWALLPMCTSVCAPTSALTPRHATTRPSQPQSSFHSHPPPLTTTPPSTAPLSSSSTPSVSPRPTSGNRAYMWGTGKPFFPSASQKEDSLTPKLFSSPSASFPLIDLSVGDHHFALLTADGSVYTGGQGQYSELGWQGRSEHGMKRVEGLPACVSVRCGMYHTVALTESGEVYVWGWGGSFFSPNALGIGRKSTCTTPTLVPALQSTPVQQIAVGKEHSLALTRAGELYAWGKGETGRLGLGGSSNQPTPQRLDALTGEGMEVAAITAGSSFNAAVLRSGALYTWGLNDHGQLGQGGGLVLDQYKLITHTRCSDISVTIVLAALAHTMLLCLSLL